MKVKDRARAAAIWLVFAFAALAPIAVAAMSPYLAYREPIYIIAGFAGVAAMALVLAQPLLAGGHLPGLRALRGRRAHRWVGAALVSAVVIHIGGLWITSPPDVIDALLFTSPTPFSAWGVVAMWTLFAAAALAVFRKRLRLAPKTWRLAHMSLVAITAGGGVAHAMLIEGTMGVVTKAMICAVTVIVTAKVIADRAGRFRQ